MKGNTYIVIINLGLLIFALAIPVPLKSLLDGVPFSSNLEVIIIAIALPFLVIAGRRFLAAKWLMPLVVFLIVLKLFGALIAPSVGIEVRAYENQKKFNQGDWERTYQSLWRPGCSDLMKKGYEGTRNFPLEWLNHYNDRYRRAAVNVVLSLKGWINIPPGYSVAVVARDAHKSALLAGKYQVPVVAHKQEIRKIKPIKMPSGVLPLTGFINYFTGERGIGRTDWNLQIYLVSPDGRLTDAFKANALWSTTQGANFSPFWVTFWWCFFMAVDLFMVLVLAAWTLWTLRRLIKLKILNLWISACAMVGIMAPYIYRFLWADRVECFGLGIITAAVMVFLWALRQEENKYKSHDIALIVLVALGPGILLHYLNIWWGTASAFTLYTNGDDWLTYQMFASHIALEGDWFHFDHRPVLTYQPLYRYIVAILHVFFGQSSLAQKLFDVWSVVGAASILAAMARYWRVSLAWCLLAPAIYLIPVLIDRFLFLIGIGLQEYPAMLFMVAVAWTMLQNRDKNPRILKPSILAIIAFLLRPDHILGLAALVLLAYPPILGNLIEAWTKLLRLLLGSWKRIVSYGCVLLGGVLAIAFRNWVGGNEFVINKASNLQYLSIKTWAASWDSINLLLTARDSGIHISGFMLWAGVLIGLICLVIRMGLLKRYPLELGLILLCIIAPYFLLKVNAYTPRFSVHLLPFAVLSLLLAIRAIWTQAREKMGLSDSRPTARASTQA
ncbi:MAG: hypothetical protein KQI62_08740 [Deltaproteobacteria bacterium]|nr:hypothetical protein [Deltaproteobacteria bacterium]